jgi:hypothetical protein
LSQHIFSSCSPPKLLPPLPLPFCFQQPSFSNCNLKAIMADVQCMNLAFRVSPCGRIVFRDCSCHVRVNEPKWCQGTLRANSHVQCCAHAIPLPCHAALLPFSDSAVSFGKVLVVAVNIRTAIPTV